MKVRYTATIDFNAEAAKRRLHLEPGGAVQAAIDKAVMDYSQPFIPYDFGRLSKSCYGATVAGSGEVVWPGPYAHYMYMGEVYGPNIPVFDDDSGEPTRYFSPPDKKKHPTGRKLEYTRDKHELAGPHWIENMKPVYMKDILDEAEKAMKGGG